MKLWFMVNVERLHRTRSSASSSKILIVAAKDAAQAIRGVERIYLDANVVSIRQIDDRTLEQTDLVVPHDI